MLPVQPGELAAGVVHVAHASLRRGKKVRCTIASTHWRSGATAATVATARMLTVPASAQAGAPAMTRERAASSVSCTASAPATMRATVRLRRTTASSSNRLWATIAYAAKPPSTHSGSR